MNKEKDLKKKIPRGTEKSENTDCESFKGTGNLSKNDANKKTLSDKRKISLSSKTPINNRYNETVNLVNPTGDLHLGTQITLFKPVKLTGLKRQDILTLNEYCDCNKEESINENLNKLNDSLSRAKVKFYNNVKPIHCFLFVIVVTIIYGLILYSIKYHHHNNNTNVTVNCNRINMSSLVIVNRNITNFVNRFEWKISAMLEYYLYYYYNIILNDNCTFSCNVKKKTKLKFVILDGLWFDCIDRISDCSSILYQGRGIRNFKDLPIKLNDIYYNYFIRDDGRIYEGRSLTCPFDEKGLPEDHSTIVTIGIPYCFPAISEKSTLLKANVSLAIRQLVNKLSITGILTENYTLEFPSDCRNYTFELINENETLLYENYSLNYTSWNQDLIRNLLFLKDYANDSKKKNNITLTAGPFTWDIPSPNANCENSMGLIGYLFERVIFRLYVRRYVSKTTSKIYCFGMDFICNDLNRPFVVELNETKILPPVTNYIINFPGELYKAKDLNFCSLNTSEFEYFKKLGYLEVNILVLDGGYNIHESQSNKFTLTSLAKSMKDIANDIWQFNVDYNDVNIEIKCGRLGLNISNVLVGIYEMLTPSLKYEICRLDDPFDSLPPPNPLRPRRSLPPPNQLRPRRSLPPPNTLPPRGSLPPPNKLGPPPNTLPPRDSLPPPNKLGPPPNTLPPRDSFPSPIPGEL